MIWIGISGFQYPEWKGSFYPEKMPAAKMLAFYSECFPTTEINYTFRQLPTDKAIANWLAQTSGQFRFTLKALRRITDYQRLRNCEELLRGFVEAAALLPPSVVAAFEFRDTSWFTDSVFEALRRHGAPLCVADSENLTTPTVFTSTAGYFRLRRVNYTAAELGSWAETIRDQSSRLTDIYVYLKHEEAGTGPRLAKQLMEMLGLKQPSAGAREQDLPMGL